MAKLAVFGQIQSWNEELEIRFNGGNGMDCHITYKDGESKNKHEVRHNCTEFHHRFDSFGGRASSAFESDIHSTGGTIDLDRIESIEVVMATKRHDTY